MKVENMRSRSGNAVPNQYIVTTDNGDKFFQSYATVIARKAKTGKIALDKKHWNYSTTTSKYRNQFLAMTTAETKAAINSGKIELVDLNKVGRETLFR